MSNQPSVFTHAYVQAHATPAEFAQAYGDRIRSFGPIQSPGPDPLGYELANISTSMARFVDQIPRTPLDDARDELRMAQNLAASAERNAVHLRARLETARHEESLLSPMPPGRGPVADATRMLAAGEVIRMAAEDRVASAQRAWNLAVHKEFAA